MPRFPLPDRFPRRPHESLTGFIGAYGGLADKIPLGAMMNKALAIRQCQAHVQRHWGKLLDMIVAGELDPAFAVSHRMKLSEAPEGYKMFLEKRDGCMKILLRP